jgi:hypothetical protein
VIGEFYHKYRKRKGNCDTPNDSGTCVLSIARMSSVQSKARTRSPAPVIDYMTPSREATVQARYIKNTISGYGFVC